jgi:hypothetical protein
MKRPNRSESLKIGGLVALTGTILMGIYYSLVVPDYEPEAIDQKDSITQRKEEVRQSAFERLKIAAPSRKDTLDEESEDTKSEQKSMKKAKKDNISENSREKETKSERSPEEVDTGKDNEKDKKNEKIVKPQQNSNENSREENEGESSNNMEDFLKEMISKWEAIRKSKNQISVSSIPDIDLQKHLDNIQEKLNKNLEKLKKTLKETPKKSYERSSIDYSHLYPDDAIILMNRDVTAHYSDKELEKISDLTSFPGHINPSKTTRFIYPNTYANDLRKIAKTYETIVAYTGKMLGESRMAYIEESLIFNTEEVYLHINVDTQFLLRLRSYFKENKSPEQKIKNFKSRIKNSLSEKKDKKENIMAVIYSSLHGLNLSEKDEKFFLSCYKYALSVLKEGKLKKSDTMTQEESKAFYVGALKDMLYTTQYQTDDNFFEEGLPKKTSPVIKEAVYVSLLKEINEIDKKYEPIRTQYRWREVLKDIKISETDQNDDLSYSHERLMKAYAILKTDRTQLEIIIKKLEKVKDRMIDLNLNTQDIANDIVDVQTSISKLPR